MVQQSFGDGRYEVLEQLGAGGMGEVWAATDTGLSRPVAIKVLSESLAGDSMMRGRFHQEIKAAAAVDHPNVVPIYDVGFEDAQLYIVMRLVEGKDLDKLLKAGALGPDRAMKLFTDAAAGLQAVHEAGIVHRDVKPSNLLVGRLGLADEYAVLTDFGIAKALEAPTGLTRGRPPGTAGYMAPEMWQQWTANAASDQYALACVLFELLAGRPPFLGATVVDLEREHCETAPPPLGEFLPEAPRSLTEALDRALAKDPRDRFESVADFAAAANSEPFIIDVPQIEPSKPNKPATLELSPNHIAVALLGMAPDRDERAAHLAMETYLTLSANNYSPPVDGALRSPKRRHAGLRSLALGTNFFEGLEGQTGDGHSLEQLGELLAKGQDFSGSAHMGLAQRALRSLVDNQTVQGSAGATLLLPFHEGLLWFDARKSGTSNGSWSVRKVNMRGTGITLARMLLQPPESLGPEVKDGAAVAIRGLRSCLQAPSPFAPLAEALAGVAPDEFERAPDELIAWNAADVPTLHELSRRVVRHVRNIASQSGVSPSSRLLQVRAILALDVAHHIAEKSWEAGGVAGAQRYLLLTYAPEERRKNRVRIASEASFQAARQAVIQALIATIARRAEELASTPDIDFAAQFVIRKRNGEGAALEEVADALREAAAAGDSAAFATVAGRAYEEASGGGYGRPVDGFRVLLESIEMLNGTGAYRWLRAGPELLGAMIGAVGGGPMESTEFLALARREWSVVVGESEAVGTALENVLDGGMLNRNARHLERLLVASGLAQALSDQTCMVGQRLVEAT